MTARRSRDALDAGIVSNDAARLIAFYRDVLGLAELGMLRFPGQGVVHRLSCGSSLLRIFVPESVPPVDTGALGFPGATGIRYLGLAVVDLAEVVDAVRARGCEVPFGPAEIRPGVWSAQIRDPDGNWIELLQGA